MSTWGKIIDGRAHQIVVGISLDSALDGKFHPDWIAANKPLFVALPNTDTGGKPIADGALSNGNGIFTNPAPPSLPPAPDTATLGIFMQRRAQAAAKNGDISTALYLLSKTGD